MRSEYSIETKEIIFDFNSDNKFQQLESLLTDIDYVSILVNNVGVANRVKFREEDIDQILN